MGDFSHRNENKFLIASKQLLAGGIAGMCSKTTVAPLDRVKILLQAQKTIYKDLGVFSGLRAIVQNENFIGLYKGNGAQMVRVFPYAAVQFFSYENYKKFLKEIGFTSTSSNSGIAGSLAGLTSVLATYPLDVVRARFAFQVAEESRQSIYRTLVAMFHTEGGIQALYKGLTPTLLGIVPYAGLSFYTFETLKSFTLQYFPDRFGVENPSCTGGMVLSVPAKLFCGAMAGAIAQTVSYPLDVSRRRMQLSMISADTHKYSKDFVTTLTHVFREDGISRGLYRGMSINYIRAIPMVSVSFATYEMMKQMLGLDTGITN